MSSTPEHPTEEQKHKDFIESLKIAYDLFKHLTTLSTGSLLLLATLLEKFFKAPHWSALIGVTFAAFAVSLAGSLALMFVISQGIAGSGKTDEKIDALGITGVLLAVGGFLTGIAALIVFTLKNFYT